MSTQLFITKVMNETTHTVSQAPKTGATVARFGKSLIRLRN